MSTVNDFIVRQVSGRPIPLRGDDIDTDRIIPARFLRCVTFDGLEDHVFEDDRLQSSGSHPFDRPSYRGASILVANRNFGCGSSREHAPQGLQRWGIRGIIGVSFAEIFFGNCVSLGLPCVTLPPSQVEDVQARAEANPSVTVTLDLERKEVVVGDPGATSVRYACELPDGARQSFLGGTWDATGLLLSAPEDVLAVAKGLPYLQAFTG